MNSVPIIETLLVLLREACALIVLVAFILVFSIWFERLAEIVLQVRSAS